MIDHFDQAIVEVSLRIAELRVRLLEQRIVVHINPGHSLRIDTLSEPYIQAVAGIVGGTQRHDVTLPRSQDRYSRRLERQQPGGELPARQVVYGDDEMTDQVFRQQDVVEAGLVWDL